MYAKMEDLFTDAAAEGNLPMLFDLLSKGARIDDVDKDGYTALMMAVKKNHTQCVEYLLECGANPNKTEGDGWSVLHEAALAGLEDIARLLLRWGAKKDATDIEGNTPLQLAVRYGNGTIAYMLTQGHDSKMIDGITPKQRYCLHIAYIGTRFVGWQRQREKIPSDLITVQETVEETLTFVLKMPQRVNVTSASRTDAGTHALYQYATFRIEVSVEITLTALLEQLNQKLPEDIIVHSILPVDPLVVRPARIRSLYKKYVYYIQQAHRPDLEKMKYSWYIAKRLHLNRLRQALRLLEGTHDFRPFSQSLQKQEFADMSTIRTIVHADIVLKRNVTFSMDPNTCGHGDLMDEKELFQSSDGSIAKSQDPSIPLYYICFEFIANGFLRHMVRRIIGTLRPIGEGTFPASHVLEVLASKTEAGPSAPSKGLWLDRSWLTQEEWDNDFSSAYVRAKIGR